MEPLYVHVDDGYLCAGLRECVRSVATDSFGAACDDCDFFL
jgi:hypothetical protein